ncbi:hypothetical protein [Streptomyces sp. Qhu_M48]|uniref:hypothetical protein n=1 Tax=Streptomyces sp. Qhu_M48 TaxID=3435889 RepID=UPI003F50A796
MPSAPDAEWPGHAYDPGEVTVQLDAVRIGGGAYPSLRPAVTVPEPRRAPNGPVFVDESGRRGRRFRHLGTFVGVACAAYAGVIVATLLTGNSAAPWVPLPEQGQAVPAERGEASPSPASPATLSPTASTPSAPTTTDGGGRSSTPVRTADSSANTPTRTTPTPTASTATPTPRTTTESPGPGSSGTPTSTPTTPAPTGTPTTAPATTAPTGTTAPETTAPPVASGSVALGHSRPASAGQDHVPPSPEIIL